MSYTIITRSAILSAIPEENATGHGERFTVARTKSNPNVVNVALDDTRALTLPPFSLDNEAKEAIANAANLNVSPDSETEIAIICDILKAYASESSGRAALHEAFKRLTTPYTFTMDIVTESDKAEAKQREKVNAAQPAYGLHGSPACSAYLKATEARRAAESKARTIAHLKQENPTLSEKAIMRLYDALQAAKEAESE